MPPRRGCRRVWLCGMVPALQNITVTIAMNVTAPETLFEQEFGLIADLVHAYAQERPRHPALIDEQRSLSYGELDQLMNRVAVALQRDRVDSGAAVAICAASCVDYGVVFLGALR